MITVYAGLWYLTGDIGYETSIIVFVIILFANAVFGIMWIIAYVGTAEWAETIIRKLSLED